MKSQCLALAIAACLSCSATAEESNERNWDASAELGWNVTSGNTDTSSLKTRLKVTHDLENWDNTYLFDGLRKEDEGEVSADKWLLSAKGNYKLDDPNTFMYLFAQTEGDGQGAFKNYNTLAFGYGERLYETETITLDADIGPGYTFFTRNDDTESEDNSAIVRASAGLTWNISESATFEQTVSVDKELRNEKNTKTRLESSVSAKINGQLQMKFGLTVINNSEVSEDKKKTDTETSFTLVYAF